MPPIRTILYATDFSKPSEYAFRVAGSLASDQVARLIVVHILHAVGPTEWISERMAGVFPWTEDCNEALEQRVRPLLQSSPGLRVERRVVEGIPSEEILRAAESEPCDLIVMGNHGRTGLDRVLMGSVAEAVMRMARCPVMTVKGPTPAPPAAPSANAPQPAGSAGRK
jgi:nucleotide-binding universal stress UspA family protein